MLVLGLILVLVGWFTNISLLTALGSVLLIIGVVFFVLGSTGRPVGGRRYWF